MTIPPRSPRYFAGLVSICLLFSTCAFAQANTTAKRIIPLPSSKYLMEPVPGSPQKTNSLPMAMAVSPNGRYVAIVNAGYGTEESNGDQSIAVLDTRSGKLLDFPNVHTFQRAKQTFFSGVAFSSDGSHLYVSIASLTNPLPDKKNAVGNGILVYGFEAGKLTEQRILPISLQPLAVGKSQNDMTHSSLPFGMANPFPSGLSVVRGRGGKQGSDRLLIADNLSDDALLMRSSDGTILHRFDLSTSQTVPASYPIATIVTRDGRRGFVALWNASAVAELDLTRGRVLQILPLLPPRIATDPSSHPTALATNRDQSILYVALANRDSVAAIAIRPGAAMHTIGFFDTRLPGQIYFGAVPDALALSPDGNRLYVADASLDAVAVFNPHALTRRTKVPIPPHGFIPTEWYPTALAATASHIYVATGKGQGTGPNNFWPGHRREPPANTVEKSVPRTYIATLLYGSLAAMDRANVDRHLPELSHEVMESNRMLAAQQKIVFRTGGNPIRHIIYIIKENRSYDQIFGDLPAGNSDPSLTMYGEAITPNEHKLAMQFGVLDNFYDSGEVSGDGHVWSTAAITTDYTEKTWQQSYRSGQRTYDYEGMVANGNPRLENISDVDDPESGYLWTNLALHGKSYYHFGEFISTTFCGTGKSAKMKTPLQGTPEPAPMPCARSYIRKGETIPANYGGGISHYPWKIPLIERNTATKPELVGHFDPQYQDFNLSVPDQFRVSEFLVHFHQWVADRARGTDTMPAFVMLRLPDDHTAGTRPGMPRPEASVADNDLAVGRAVDAVSHSAYWNDTAFFILEDDAQNGADHVDAHRSLMLVVSKYAPRPKANGAPFVDDHFYTTVSAVHTLETLLGLPPMNNNDAFAPLMAPEFSGAGAQPAFSADYANRDNGRIYEANTPKSYGAKESAKMNFTQADMADTGKLNIILWRDEMGKRPVPSQLLRALHHPAAHHDSDDD